MAIHSKILVWIFIVGLINISCDKETPSVKPAAFFTFKTGDTNDDYYDVQFTDESKCSEPISWEWDFGVEDSTSDISLEQHPSYEYPQVNGTYTVNLVVTTEDGSQDSFSSEVKIQSIDTVYIIQESDTVFIIHEADTIYINPNIDDPVAGFVFEVGETTSDFSVASFSDASTGAMSNSWKWDFGVEGVESDTSNLQHPVFTYPANDGVYTVTLTVTNALGVTSTHTEEVEIKTLYYTTKEELEAAVDWTYTLLAHENIYGRKLTLALMVRSDMVTIGDISTSSNRIECDQMIMNVSNNDLVDTFWPRGYELIDTVYTIVEDAGKDIEIIEESEVNELLAEARFSRALMHYHFVRLFGQIPLRLTSNRNLDQDFTVFESTTEEVYQSIIEDLTFAKTHLPDNITFRIRPSKSSAAGMLASVYLTLEDWQNAYNEASTVINAGDYSLEANYEDLFGAAEGGNEILFEIDNVGEGVEDVNLSDDFLGPMTGQRGDERWIYGDGWSVLVPSEGVHTTWSNDYRKAVSLDTVMTFNGDPDYFYTDWDLADSRNVTRPYIAKYYRATGQAGYPAGTNLRNSETNYIVMRYAEVLLIAAEAAYELGNTNDAVNYINQIRSRARAANGIPRTIPADITFAGLTLDVILEERRIELAFEYKRWYDIQRRKMGELVYYGLGAIDLERQPFEVTDYLFPKPQSAIDAYPNIFQNPGY